VLEVENVIWCTGFRQDFPWISSDVIPGTGRDAGFIVDAIASREGNGRRPESAPAVAIARDPVP
jgi:hypothetical protein